MNGTIADLETGGIGLQAFSPDVHNQPIRKGDQNNEGFMIKLLKRLELGEGLFNRDRHKKRVCRSVCNWDRN